MHDRNFEKQLDVILENTDVFGPASEALGKLSSANDSTREAAAGLQREVDRLNHQLALQIRQHSPSLNVVLGRDGRCTVKYKDYRNSLRLWPNVEHKRFECGDTPFEKAFKRYHGHTLTLEPEIIGKAVADYFKQRYASLKD